MIGATAARRAEWLSRRIGEEVRTARRTRGWSQRELGERIRVSQTIVSRVERGWVAASVSLLCELTASLGLELNARVFPTDQITVRDVRQLELAQLIVQRANAAWHPAIEAPASPDPADHRAVDLLLGSAVELCAIEIERDLANFEGQLRADMLKRDLLAQRDSRPVRFILALPETRRLRLLVRAFRPLIDRTLPVPSRHIWSAIRTGKPVGGDGLLWLPPIRSRP